MNKRNVDITGNRYGRLTVIRFERIAVLGGRQRQLWLCVCECGKEHLAEKYKLTSGHTRSCGCLSFNRCGSDNPYYKHGLESSSIYDTWYGMVDRCTNSRNRLYSRYGGRGIAVCPEWMEDIKAFYRDMGEKPFEGAQIDRIDNNKGYNKENCRWVSAKENNRNRGNNRIVTVAGISKTVAEWAEVSGIAYQTLWYNVNKGRTDMLAAFV